MFPFHNRKKKHFNKCDRDLTDVNFLIAGNCNKLIKVITEKANKVKVIPFISNCIDDIYLDTIIKNRGTHGYLSVYVMCANTYIS